MPAYWENGTIPWLSLKDIRGLAGKYITETIDHPTELGIANSSARLLPPGTVALCRTASVGNVVILGKEMATSQDFVDWVCSEDLLPEYLYWAFKGSEATFELEKQGSTHQTIYMPTVERFQVLLPPLPEQRRIADILDRAESLRAQRRAAIAQLDELTQAIFVEMFGDVEGNGWPVADVAGVLHEGDNAIRTGPFGSQLLHSEFVESGIAVLGIDNVVTNEFRWTEPRCIAPAKYKELQRYTVRPGDVLITIMGTCGRCAIVPEDVPVAINTKHLCCISLNQKRCLPTFLHAYFLRHSMARSYLERAAKGAIMSGLNMGIVKAMPLPIPPLALQREYAERIRAIRGLGSVQSKSSDEMNSFFESLQHRAFRGEL